MSIFHICLLFNRIHINIEILKIFGFRELIFNSVRLAKRGKFYSFSVINFEMNTVTATKIIKFKFLLDVNQVLLDL